MNVFRHRIESDDFDIFTETERSIGITADRMQLSAGSGNFLSDYMQVGDITLWRYHADHKIRHEYTFPDDLVELSISHYPTGFSWCGMEVTGASAAIHVGGRSYECVTPAGGTVYGFVFPKSLALQWELFSPAQLSRMSVPENAVSLDTDPFQRALLENANKLLDSDCCLASGEDVFAAQEMLVSGCQRILDARFRDVDQASAVPSFGLIKRAQRLMTDRLEEGLTAAGIASELGVSRRGLELGFQNVLGISPYQFLLVQRLHKARRILKDDLCTILEACVRSGFTNTGRFARMYSRHFGELPSQTSSGRNGSA